MVDRKTAKRTVSKLSLEAGMRRFLALWVPIAFISLALSPAAAQRPAGIKLGMMNIAAVLPLFTALEKGFFEEEGVKLAAIPLAGGAVALPAIAGGSLDVAFTAIPSVIIARDKGFDFLIITHNNSNTTLRAKNAVGYRASDALLVPKGSAITTARDLEGKSVAVNTLNNISWLMAQAWMEKKGADPTKVTWVEIDFPKMEPALLSGKVDAIHGTEPFTSLLVAKGQVEVLDYHFSAVRPEVAIASYVASAAWVKRNAEALERFVRAHARGVDYINRHPEERVPILTRYTKIPPELIKNMVHYKYLSRLTLEELGWWSDLIYKKGLTKRVVEPSEVVYRTALQP